MFNYYIKDRREKKKPSILNSFFFFCQDRMNSDNTILPSPPTSPIENNSTRKRTLENTTFYHKTTSSNKKYKFDLNCLKSYLIDKQGSPNICDEQFKRSLLSWACIGKSTEAIQYLKTYVHLDINLKSGPQQTTALHEASLSGFNEGVDILLQHPDIDINAVDKEGKTAIHYAIQFNHRDTLKILLSAGARIDVFAQGRLPIHTAIMYGYHQCVSLLLSKSTRHDNNPTSTDMLWKKNLIDHKSGIEMAIMAGYTITLQLLLDHDSSSSPPHQTMPGLVSLAIHWNRIESLQLLIKRGCLVDHDCLLLAVQQRKIDMVRELIVTVNPCLENGQNPSFLYACNHGFMDMIPLLLTLNTSKDCIEQALLLATPIGLRDTLTKTIVYTLKSLATSKKMQPSTPSVTTKSSST